VDKNSFDSLLVWDTDKTLPLEHCGAALWQSYSVSDIDREVSVPQLVEDNAEHLRSAYLDLIYKLGETKVSGKRVIDHLEIRPDFSYWWMTLLVECNYSKSPQIDNAVKLMAFRAWIVEKSCSNISLVTSSSELASAMRLLATELGINFTWKRVTQEKKTFHLLKYIFGCLPKPMQSIVWLINYIITRWPLKGVGVDRWIHSQAKTTFVSYLFHLDLNTAKQGYFKSGYWTELPGILEQEKVQSNWLHFYVKNELLPTATDAKNLICRFNRSHTGNQNHVVLESFLGIRVLWTSIRNWYRLVKLKQVLEAGFREKCDYLWPFFEQDVQASFVGIPAMSNLMFIALFEKAMSTLPTQEQGCYLLENQAWEFGFINAWRTAKHGRKLIGLAHATVRYWDLRYFFDSRIYNIKNKCDMPTPDLIAVNGVAARKMYLDSAFPINQLVDVEALRYLYLNHLVQNIEDSTSNILGENILLVLGDYMQVNTKYQMDLLLKANQYIDTEIKYVVKPHPACPILAEDYPQLKLIVTNDPIPMLITHCSMVFTSSATSAAVDAYCAGKRVVTALDIIKLNLSPLKDCESVSFVSSPEELAAILNQIDSVKEINGQGKDFFYLDSELPRWRKLLIQNNNTAKKISLEDV
jgi:surface carbohydrate biosynthesis protein (TIGR04326 family)